MFAKSNPGLFRFTELFFDYECESIIKGTVAFTKSIKVYKFIVLGIAEVIHNRLLTKFLATDVSFLVAHSME